jgi:hypothetical protein
MKMSNATRESEGFRSLCVSVLLACLVSGAAAGDTDCGWTALGGPLGDIPSKLVIYDSGSGPQPHVAVRVDLIVGQAFSGVQGWNGQAWEPLGPAPGVDMAYIENLAVYDDGSGPTLFAEGQIDLSDGRDADIARWDGTAWITFDPDVIKTSFSDMIVFDDGSGPALYGGGGRVTLNGVPTESRVAKFDGSVWSAVDTGMQGQIGRFAIFDDGSGDALYAVGSFSIGGVPGQVARLDGSSWTVIGDGLGDFLLRALAVFDDGSGPALYAGGVRYSAGLSVLRWDGSEWVSISDGLEGDSVLTLLSHDDGTGPALYAGGGGEYELAGVDIGAVAKWDGSEWSAVGESEPISEVTCPMVSDRVAGLPALYIGGSITASPSNPPHSVSRWISPSAICPADVDGNCGLNFFDVRAFLALFTAQDPAADFNGDGLFNFVDVSDFVDAFVAGCP